MAPDLCDDSYQYLEELSALNALNGVSMSKADLLFP